MNSKQLQYALVLARVQNFSRAAQELNITQPAFSKQIIALENELGVKLFDRESNPLSLTPAGEFFVKKAKNILFEQETLIKAMGKYKSGESGKLTIGIAPFRSLYVMPRVVAAVKERFPEVHISLQEYGLSQLRKGLTEGLYDFAVMNLPVDEAVFDVIPLEADSLVLAVPEGLTGLIEGDNERSFVDLADCKKLPFAVVGQNQEMRKLFDRLCSKAGLDPEIYVEVTGVTTLGEMVRSGLAAGVLPKQFAKMEEGDAVKFFELKQDKQIRRPAVVTVRGQYISEYAEYAIKLLKEI